MPVVNPTASATPLSAKPVNLQSVRNLALLARQAISNQYPTMSVSPTEVADFCAACEDTLKPGSHAEKLAAALVEVEAAKRNIASLGLQIEKRYTDGILEGVKRDEAQIQGLLEITVRISREKPQLDVNAVLVEAKAEYAKV